MKKILILLIAILPVVAFAKKKVIRNLYVSSPIVSDKPEYKNDSVCFKFKLIAGFLDVEIDNNTDNRIAVEWDNVRLRDNEICFSDDDGLTYKLPKKDEVIHAGSYTKKMIIMKRCFENYLPLFSEFMLKEFGEASVKVIIPIKYPTETIDYTIRLMLKEEEQK